MVRVRVGAGGRVRAGVGVGVGVGVGARVSRAVGGVRSGSRGRGWVEGEG